MHMLNAISLTRMAARSLDTVSEAGHLPLGSLWWIIYAGISFVLVLFAGIMSGLTLGLMSLSRVDLEILQRSGNPSEKNQAGDYYSPLSNSSISLPFLCYLYYTLNCIDMHQHDNKWLPSPNI